MALSGQQLGELGLERDVGGLRHVQEGHVVEHIGEPLALFLPVQVHTPEGVVERFGAHGHLGGERLLRQVLEGTAHLEVLGEVVLPVNAHHRLSGLSIVGVALIRGAHRRVGIQDALVDDGHLAGRIVDGIVGALSQGDTARGDHHGALRHIVGTERDDICRIAAILSHEHVLVFLGYLLGHGLGGVVELSKSIFLRRGQVYAL